MRPFLHQRGQSASQPPSPAITVALANVSAAYVLVRFGQAKQPVEIERGGWMDGWTVNQAQRAHPGCFPAFFFDETVCSVGGFGGSC